MIKSFNHKGLKKFFETGDASGIIPSHARRLTVQLGALDRAVKLEQLNVPGWNFHKLRGDMKDCVALTVNKNWRLTFKFEDGNVYILDYRDYH
ncbi:type II toxin-antitoxin system RelE/ParE family toxin [uncultured Parasutterella sp.]|jgi:proteic killer suppression protein|uniref:type II toxin-antitoxin system RelE/ParE family toxin n=1 Tax=uncultured Parasutterella sp. TaxID=1263098 RepID=UPI0025CC30E3|nr:type II toxin-antitoxin system RelE/ParE family toxin [uncultured Parasutterella sp.]